MALFGRGYTGAHYRRVPRRPRRRRWVAVAAAVGLIAVPSIASAALSSSSGLTLAAGDSIHASCATKLSTANRTRTDIDLRCAKQPASTTTTAPATTTTTAPATTTTTTTPPTTGGGNLTLMTIAWGGWGANSGAAQADEDFITSLGGNPAKAVAMDFFASDTWDHAAVSIPSGLGAGYATWPGQMCWALPLAVNGETSADFAAHTKGDVDSYIVAMGQSITAQFKAHPGNGKPPIIRLGWEFNDGWPPYAANGDTTDFVAWFDHYIAVLRPTLPAGSQIMYNPDDGWTGSPTPNIDSYYPGDKAVDIIALDAYNKHWGSFPGDTTQWAKTLSTVAGLDWLTDTATAHGKTIGFGEWGFSPEATGPNDNDSPGDDPVWATNTMGWIKDRLDEGHNVVWGIWNLGSSALADYPHSYAALKAGVPALLDSSK